MYVLSGTYIFYADVYFIQNFIIKIAVIYLVLYCNKFLFFTTSLKGIGKILFASGLGTVMEIAGLVLGNSYHLFMILVHVLEIPFMMRIVLGKKRKQIWKVIVTGYLFIVLINGVVEWLWNYFGDSASLVLLLILACGITIIAVRVWQNYSKMQKGIFQVELLHKDRYISTYGFYDSGNRLKDPYTEKGVHIVSELLIKSLGLEMNNPVLVPYQALGNETGMIEVYYVDELVIEGENERIHLEKSPLGVTKDNLFKERKYEIILNEEVF